MAESEPITQSRSRLTVPAAVGLGLLLLALDLALKAIADAVLPLDRHLATPLPFWSWFLTYNTGSHYLLGSVGQWVPYRLLMGFAAAAVIVLVVYTAREVRHLPPSRLRTVEWAMMATLIGAMGNAVEVVWRGRATDYFMLRPFPWPSNLCDQYVNLTVFVLLPLALLLGWRQSTKPDPNSRPVG